MAASLSAHTLVGELHESTGRISELVAAIKDYTLLVTDYAGLPSTTFPNNPPPAYPQLDEVYYYLAYEYEQANDTANARRVYDS